MFEFILGAIVFLWMFTGFIFCILASIDASNRGKSGCFVFLLVFFLGPIGFIIWMIIRPKLPEPPKEEY